MNREPVLENLAVNDHSFRPGEVVALCMALAGRLNHLPPRIRPERFVNPWQPLPKLELL